MTTYVTRVLIYSYLVKVRIFCHEIVSLFFTSLNTKHGMSYVYENSYSAGSRIKIYLMFLLTGAGATHKFS